jgi:hypothetical protein
MELEPCKDCRTDKRLRYKRHPDGKWQVICKKCGDCSELTPNAYAAGVAWNRSKRLQYKEGL